VITNPRTRGVRSLIVSILVLVSANSIVASAQVAVSDKVVNADRYPQVRVNFPGEVVGLPKVTYYKPSSRPVLLDLYLPPARTNTVYPFIVYVHGGGWSGGTQRTTGAFEDWPGVLASIAAKGYVVASVDYRLSGEAPFPAAVQDVKAAIRWLRINAATYGVDKSRGLVWGPSAGGHLAGLVGASCGAADLEPVAVAQPASGGSDRSAESAPEESDCVQGVVGWYGIYDFALNAASEREDSGLARFLGCNIRSCAESVIRAANPVSYIDRTDPPMLIIHGDADRTASPEHSRRMYEKLKANGVKTELIMLPGIGHSWIGQNHDATINASRSALEKTIAFIDATIGARAPVNGSAK
jgi:acetyl esterase/lipase